MGPAEVPMPVFCRPVVVRFEEADARGILFYGRIQALAHHLFEDFVVAEIVPRWEDWFQSDRVMTPIKHAEATFHRPMVPGRQYDGEVRVSKVGGSSFEITTRFVDRAAPEPVLCAETRVVKVFTDPVGMRKMPIPSAIRARLEACLAGE
jgi:4-hydroxybenzoyl-CoA thioesterase